MSKPTYIRSLGEKIHTIVSVGETHKRHTFQIKNQMISIIVILEHYNKVITTNRVNVNTIHISDLPRFQKKNQYSKCIPSNYNNWPSTSQYVRMFLTFPGQRLDFQSQHLRLNIYMHIIIMYICIYVSSWKLAKISSFNSLLLPSITCQPVAFQNGLLYARFIYIYIFFFITKNHILINVTISSTQTVIYTLL